jgi:NAD+ synthetase
MRVALCQLNCLVGDLRGNASRILSWYRQAVDRGAELVVLPELALTGYPPRDLLELTDFVAEAGESLFRVAGETGSAGLILGTPIPNPIDEGKPLLNGAVLCSEGKVRHEVGKKLLPIYDVFDEARHFEEDRSPATPVEFGGIQWGVHICEDAWNEDGFWPRRLYLRDPVEELAENGAQVLLNISASPFHARKIPLRRSMFQSHCRSHGLPLLYTNTIGGNDELVFDGEAYVFDASGTLLASGRPFQEEMVFVDIEPTSPATVKPVFSWDPNGTDEPRPAEARPELDDIDSVHQALLLGLGDYAAKCGFSTAALGLSGGIDSALTAVLAAQALGPENIWGISLPSRYSSPGSLTDAEVLAKNLGIRYEALSIETSFAAGLETLSPLFDDLPTGAAEENMQARTRGLLLMALSNKFGHLLLSTGNKSELAVGYCTLYGDMAGGLAVISDVPKTMVYALSRHLNRDGVIIPESTLTKEPSAELKPDQEDRDTLPPYELLDRILEGYIGEGLPVAELVAQGLPEETVERVVRMVAAAEYKRRQAAPGIKISPKAFGFGRRMPLATGWPPQSGGRKGT